jgi:hypothetical protein
MPITINGTTGISGVDGSASTPALVGTDADTGFFFSAGLLSAAANGVAGRVPAMQFFRLDSGLAGSNVNTAQSVLGVGVTLTASTVYAFEGLYLLSKSAGTTSHTVGTGFGGTATLNNIGYNAQGAIWSSNPAQGGNYGDLLGSSATATAVTQAQATAAATAIIKVCGTVSINVSGTFIPQYILSAAPGGAYTTAAGSFFAIWPLGAAGGNISIGSWS